MKKSILNKIFITLVISLLICSVVSSIILTLNSEQITKQEMTKTLNTISDLFDENKDIENQVIAFSKIFSLRVTILNSNGDVLADSEIDKNNLDNHLNRKELKLIDKNNYGVATRYSTSIHKNLMYVACKFNDNIIIRISKPFDDLFTSLIKISPAIFIAVIFSIIIGFYISKKLTKNLTKPLYDINNSLNSLKIHKPKLLDEKDYNYEELNNIAKKVNQLSNQITNSNKNLNQQINKTDYILDNISEGLLIVDKELKIKIVNNQLIQLFNIDADLIGKNLFNLTQEINFIKSISDCIENEKICSIDINIKEQIYQCNINFVNNEYLHGAIIIFINVTDLRKAQKVKQEIFSNISHELKTPITSIKGFAEILKQDLVKDKQKQQEFLDIIIKQSNNMSNLINDILFISRLENGELSNQKQNINLLELTNDILQNLTPLINQKNLCISLSNKPIYFNCDKNQIYCLISNIISNAIKYNIYNGNININLKSNSKSIIIEIQDSGIGIPSECLERIFERFYRVDKDRNKNISGTGLGLSIVKHIANLYNGNITVDSKLNVGTKFIIKLSK